MVAQPEHGGRERQSLSESVAAVGGMALCRGCLGLGGNICERARV